MPAKPLLDIIHEDEFFVVVNKPPGMLSVPGKGPERADCVAARVRQMYPGCPAQPEAHRLDMDTSGLIVMCRTVECKRLIQKQFQDRVTAKKYIALLEGELAEEIDDEGIIELPFRLDIDNRPIQIYDEVHGKMGITKWRKLGVENGWTRVEFRPVTGRTHQLRVHAAHAKGLGIPIVEDVFYGNGVRGQCRLRLHAAELSFFHPLSDEKITFVSEPDF
ncbi:RluA family pseudouridine synthase [Persicirhabdus sediminis]|uniref:RluA family pseudouridine synthase n=1 Tax=Persicirhabdus sediminis TaxID=454144 RepID=A0A8J7SKW3_9BACT|nr:RluA family pseudouridine synthase [Persicirhabdus sediminis]MBK1792374.1 RluA family pseudouridine synthase [Persicirhabdus sediminis]